MYVLYSKLNTDKNILYGRSLYKTQVKLLLKVYDS